MCFLLSLNLSSDLSRLLSDLIENTTGYRVFEYKYKLIWRWVRLSQALGLETPRSKGYFHVLFLFESI